ncbi:hypothetical protein RGU70_05300 [Herbaspirillum sp. RTI4]|uniref:hypothetical protein n=1 Tax=Herbaspirillum sp. RTI4 TaxID=3048640 RepID=UPI002AB519D9|nr:hypothetical protein [Herbaspirillum sp. RTI4]MDY7577733.1 hypothetical protein [Herbaspirillum sp. RTI4]MEA9980839.1 hypothetical protein [Herbaspirillum sp. RTI4]
MKFTTQLIAASALAMTVGSALAATNVANVKVKGKVGIGSCEFTSTAADHTIDLGEYIRSGLGSSSPTPLPAHDITLKVACTAQTAIKLHSIDSGKASVTSFPGSLDFQFVAGTNINVGEAFILAPSNATDATKMNAVGLYVMKAGDIKVTTGVTGAPPVIARLVDGATIDAAIANSGFSSTQFMTNKTNVHYRLAPADSASQNASGTHFEIPLKVATTLVKKTDLPMPKDTDTLEFEGSATITVAVM